MYMSVPTGEMCTTKAIKSFMLIKESKKHKLLNKNIADITFLSPP